MPCGWEGNCASHWPRSQTSVVYPPTGSLRKGVEHPAYTSHGVRHTLPYCVKHPQWAPFSQRTMSLNHLNLSDHMAGGILHNQQNTLSLTHPAPVSDHPAATDPELFHSRQSRVVD